MKRMFITLTLLLQPAVAHALCMPNQPAAECAFGQGQQQVQPYQAPQRICQQVCNRIGNTVQCQQVCY